MANAQLFRSIVVAAVFHLAAAWLWPADELLIVHYSVGIATSLLNHGLTSSFWKWMDRVWMLLGAALDLWYSTHLPPDARPLAFTLIAVYAAAYLAAKFMNHSTQDGKRGDHSHRFTHAGGTILHVGLLWSRRHCQWTWVSFLAAPSWAAALPRHCIEVGAAAAAAVAGVGAAGGEL